MLMGKVLKGKFGLILLLVLGISLVAGSLFLIAQAAISTTPIGTPGQRLDEVTNLYLRSLKWDGYQWQAGTMTKLGRFFGGYVVGYQICHQYVEQPPTDSGNYLCQGSGEPVTSQGFGMLFQRTDKSLAIAIPLDKAFCESHSDTCRVPPGMPHPEDIFPWFIFDIMNIGAGGFQYGTGTAAGYGDSGVEFPGYVSVEVRIDVEARSPMAGE